MATASLSTLTTSLSSLSFSSQISPTKPHHLSLPLLRPNPSLRLSISSVVATEENLQTTNLTKYLKSRLPGGFSAQSLIGTRRRKSAIARVVIQEGTGKLIINYGDANALSQTNSSIKGLDKFSQSCLAFQVTALVTTIVEPAYAVTGVNYELDWVSIIIESAVCAFLYFLVAPPIIMNWLRVRWFKRNVYEMYLQFMFVFLFFPGVLLWAPFLNFRKFPRDPSMKYPWSVPEDPSKIRNDYRKAPWATLEDYEV